MRTPCTLLTAALITAFFLASCQPEAADKEAPMAYEGDDAGECGDSADNERDGYFVFSSDLSTLEDWRVHSEPDGYDEAEWYILQMGSAWSDSSATLAHTEDEYIAEAYLTLTHTVRASFTTAER